MNAVVILFAYVWGLLFYFQFTSADPGKDSRFGHVPMAKFFAGPSVLKALVCLCTMFLVLGRKDLKDYAWASAATMTLLMGPVSVPLTSVCFNAPKNSIGLFSGELWGPVLSRLKRLRLLILLGIPPNEDDGFTVTWLATQFDGWLTMGFLIVLFWGLSKIPWIPSCESLQVWLQNHFAWDAANLLPFKERVAPWVLGLCAFLLFVRIMVYSGTNGINTFKLSLAGGSGFLTMHFIYNISIRTPDLKLHYKLAGVGVAVSFLYEYLIGLFFAWLESRSVKKEPRDASNMFLLQMHDEE